MFATLIGKDDRALGALWDFSSAMLNRMGQRYNTKLRNQIGRHGQLLLWLRYVFLALVYILEKSEKQSHRRLTARQPSSGVTSLCQTNTRSRRLQHRFARESDTDQKWLDPAHETTVVAEQIL